MKKNNTGNFRGFNTSLTTINFFFDVKNQYVLQLITKFSQRQTKTLSETINF